MRTTLEGGGCDYFERIAIDDRDTILVSGSDVGDVEIWDLKMGKLLQTLAEHLSPIIGLAISNDGETIVSGSNDGTIKIWGLPEI